LHTPQVIASFLLQTAQEPNSWPFIIIIRLCGYEFLIKAFYQLSLHQKLGEIQIFMKGKLLKILLKKSIFSHILSSCIIIFTQQLPDEIIK
jgi:hypothetical protein